MFGIELAGGAAIFGAFLLLYLAAVTYGLYTRRGSGIEARPYANRYDAASAARETRVSGRDGIGAWTRGTR